MPGASRNAVGGRYRVVTLPSEHACRNRGIVRVWPRAAPAPSWLTAGFSFPPTVTRNVMPQRFQPISLTEPGERMPVHVLLDALEAGVQRHAHRC